MDGFLEDYNVSSKAPMDLVLFRFAIEHVSRICRVLRQPNGHALLVGMNKSVWWSSLSSRSQIQHSRAAALTTLQLFHPMLFLSFSQFFSN